MYKVLIIILLILSFKLNAECLLKVRVNDVPPQYMLKEGKWSGRAVELMDVLLKEANCRAIHVKMPWQRALVELEKGNIDAMMNVIYNEQRAEGYYFIYPNVDETTVLLMRKDTDIEINTLNDLKKLPLKVAYEAGNLFDATFNKKWAQDPDFRKVFKSLGTSDMTEMVFLDRVSGELTMLENARYSLDTQEKYQQQMKILPFVISKLPSFFAFSKQSISHERMLELQAANIRAISQGLYEDVIKRWQ